MQLSLILFLTLQNNKHPPTTYLPNLILTNLAETMRPLAETMILAAQFPYCSFFTFNVKVARRERHCHNLNNATIITITQNKIYSTAD